MLIDRNAKFGNRLSERRGEIPIIFLVLSVAVIFTNTDAIAWSNENWYRVVCLLVSGFGLYVRSLTTETKGEAWHTTGIYSVIRHPLYAGDYLVWLGICAYTGSVWFIFVYTLLYFICYEKIVTAEEARLYKKFGEPYKEWSERVNAIIPDFKNRKPVEPKVYVRTIIRRTYRGIFHLTILFTLIDCLKNLAFYGSFTPDTFWIYFGGISLIYCLIVRILATKTKYLS